MLLRIFIFLILFYTSNLFGQIAVTNSSPFNSTESIVDLLVTQTVAVSNTSSIGLSSGIGYFDGYNSNIGFDEGVILSTGGIEFVTAGFGGGSAISGDSDLELALNAINLTWGVNNVTVLEFDFVAESESIAFNYVFGSSEYSNYTCSSYNDIFGLFLSGPGITGPYSNNGINLAYVPDPNNTGEYTTTPVVVNTVNSGSPTGPGLVGTCDAIDPNWQDYSVYWVDNDYFENGWEGPNQPPSPEFTVSGINGFTVPLTAEYNGLIIGELYHIKFAIADAYDGTLNSAVFLEAGGDFGIDCQEWQMDTSEGSCYYYVWESGLGYTVSDLSSSGLDCTCVENPMPGCSNELAENYNSNADIDDGSCIFDCEALELPETDPYSCYWYVWESGLGYTVTDLEGLGLNCDCVENPVFGCTDEDAVNYNPDANADNGSCMDSSCEYLITPSSYIDSGSDNSISNYYCYLNVLSGIWTVEQAVENGYACECVVLGCMDETAQNFNPLANIDDCSCYYPDLCNGEATAINVTSGSYSVEVSWVIGNENGDTVVSGGAPYCGSFCFDDGCYTIYMNDSCTCMDGWNNAILSIGENEYTLISGSSFGIASYGYNNDNCIIEGCGDPNALNFNPEVNTDDGSCEYDCNFLISSSSNYLDISNSSCFYFVNNNTFSIEEAIEMGYNCDCVVLGCMDESAENFNPLASIDDCSCNYPDLCNGEAININIGSSGYYDYEISWIIENENGDTVVSGGAPYCENFCFNDGCYTIYMNDSYGDGWDDGNISLVIGEYNYTMLTGYNAIGSFSYNSGNCIVEGCTDSNANNYNPEANTDDGACTYDCNFLTSSSSNYLGNSISNYSCNYSVGNGWGTIEEYIEDGYACECVVLGCMDDTAENFNSNVTFDNGTCEYDCETWLDTEELYSCYWYVYEYFYSVESMISYGFDCTCVENPVPGCMNPNDINYNPEANIDDGSCTNCEEDLDTSQNSCYWYVWEYNGGGSYTVEQMINFGYDCSCVEDPIIGCTNPEACNYNSSANFNDNSCELNDVCSGCTYPLACNYNPNATIDDGSCEFSSCTGCTDPGACNYDSEASIDNNSCEYSSCLDCADYEACNYNPETIIADNELCDYISCLDCADPQACNYNPETIIAANSLCIFLEDLPINSEGVFFDCNGDCIIDDNNNSICDVFDVYGCTYPEACNYNPNATFDDMSCEFFVVPCSGCTDSLACNYNPNATFDDMSCEYETCSGCTDLIACNYNPYAVIAANENCIYPSEGFNCLGEVTPGTIILCDGDQGVTPLTLYADGENVSGWIDSNIYSDDIFGGIIDIGFYFEFYGIAYNHAVISSNNYLSFNMANANTYSDWTLSALPSAIEPETQNSIMFPWQDTYPGVSGNGNISFATFGEAPNRVFVVSFCGVPMFSCTDQWTGSQVKIYESTNIIETHLSEKVVCSSWNDGAAVHGLHNASGTIAHIIEPENELPRNYPTQWIAQNEAWRFIPNGSVDYIMEPIDFNPAYSSSVVTWTDGDGNYIGSGSTITVFPTENTTYIATGIDGGDGNCGGLSEEFNIIFNECEDTEGCTDSNACNYDEYADIDDGSCWYAELGYDCEGEPCDISFTITALLECPPNLSALIVDGLTAYGGTPPYNYTWEFDGEIIADGPNETSIIVDFAEPGNTDIYYLTVTDAGNCELSALYPIYNYMCTGCTDIEACNYNEFADVDDESCFYAQEYYDCDGNCLVDTDGDEVCDPLEVLGCTDWSADNYNPNATEDDGSCFYCGLEDWFIEFDITNTSCIGANDGSFEYYVGGGSPPFTSMIWPPSDYNAMSAGCYVLSVYDANGCIIETEFCIEDTPIPCMDPVLGCTDIEACNYSPEANTDDGSCEYPEANFDCDGICVNINENCGYESYIIDVMTGQVIIVWSGSLDENCECIENGCADPAACNYYPEADIDDGSCYYPGDSYAGDIIFDPITADFIVDNECGELSSNCECCYVETYYISPGGGVEIVMDYICGCTDPLACNYDPEAQEDNDSCLYSPDPDCPGTDLEEGQIPREIVKVVDIIGQDISPETRNMTLLYIYNDGSMEVKHLLK